MRIMTPCVKLFPTPIGTYQLLQHIERAGRVCYKSEDKITEDSAEKFVSKLIRNGHTSVLEHGNMILWPSKGTVLWIQAILGEQLRKGKKPYLRLDNDEAQPLVSGNARAWLNFVTDILDDPTVPETAPEEFVHFVLDNTWLFGHLNGELFNPIYVGSYYPENSLNPQIFNMELFSETQKKRHSQLTFRILTDRGMTHELVRHRTLCFTQESTRYCNYADSRFGTEITVVSPVNPAFTESQHAAWLKSCKAAEKAYFKMLALGATPQSARAVLPTSLKAEIVVSGTIEDWERFVKLRSSKQAHPEMQWLAEGIRILLVSANFERSWGDLNG